MHNCQHSFTIANPTLEQLQAIHAIVNATTEAPATKGKAGKKTKPAKTVSDEEDEDFGKEALDEEELESEDEEEEEKPKKKKAKAADPDEEEEESEEESEEEEDGLSFEDVKAALNKYGNAKPEEAKAILLTFNLKSTKELEKHKSKWEPVYRKVMAKLKAQKKAK